MLEVLRVSATLPNCPHVHTTYAERGVINYAKSLNRKLKRGASVDDIAAALKRLRMAVDGLTEEEKRERARATR